MNNVQEKPLSIPKFATEAEEAEWWYSQRDVLSQQFTAAAKAGTLTSGRAARQLAEIRAKRSGKSVADAEHTPAAVELDPADASHALQLATQKGLDYQTYLRKLIHEALEREVALIEK